MKLMGRGKKLLFSRPSVDGKLIELTALLLNLYKFCLYFKTSLEAKRTRWPIHRQDHGGTCRT